jgi:hypothetical protein
MHSGAVARSLFIATCTCSHVTLGRTSLTCVRTWSAGDCHGRAGIVPSAGRGFSRADEGLPGRTGSRPDIYDFISMQGVELYDLILRLPKLFS